MFHFLGPPARIEEKPIRKSVSVSRRAVTDVEVEKAARALAIWSNEEFDETQGWSEQVRVVLKALNFIVPEAVPPKPSARQKELEALERGRRGW